MFDGDELTRIHIRITSKTRRLEKVVNEKTTKNIVWSDSLSSKTHRTIAIAASLKNFEIHLEMTSDVSTRPHIPTSYVHFTMTF